MSKSLVSWPNSAQSIQTSAESVTDQIDTTMNEAVSRLSGLESDASFERHPLSNEAGALLGLRGDLESLVSQGTVISATPYQFEVGQKLESGHYLSPEQARTVLVTKLRDQIDHHRPKGTLHCVVVLLSAQNKNSFANELATVTQVFSLPDWMQASRQANALVSNDQNKLHVPAPIVQPRFKPKATVNAAPFYDYEHLQAAEIATLESLASDATNVIGKLGSLASKRSNKMGEIKAQLNALKNLQGSVWAIKLSGSTDSIASQLQNTVMPNTHQHTIMSLLLSDKPLTFFEELLNV